MKPRELTVEQVKGELNILIDKYPDRTGSIGTNLEDYDCVYFTDEDGKPVSLSCRYTMEPAESFVNPVCIIGQWIEDFHPELKSNKKLQDVIATNGALGTYSSKELPFTKEVLDVLAYAQATQDQVLGMWKDIKL